MPADSPNDSAGTPITVGATVKLVGVVASMNLLDNRFNDIVVTLSHPLAASQGPALNQPTGGDLTTPGNRLTISVPPAMLTVGA